jgi:leader peptidase (prepilin peptidase)/N-methyltransferase
MPYLIGAFVFLLGLVVGSFLNVCIYRLPRGESVVHPRSHCPGCQNLVAAYDNIPVLSYLILRGRCRHCRTPISFIYPAVELLTGAVFLLTFLWWGLSPLALKMALLGAALIVLTLTDIRERILPDRVNFPLMAVGFLFAFLVPVGDGSAALLARIALGTDVPAMALSVTDALLGALVGGGVLFALGEAWYRLKGVEAMGFGDVKMMAMVGLFFGVKLTVLTLLLGSLGGSLVGGGYILLSGKDTQYELPLGTFLGLAGLFAIFWGRWTMAVYLSLFPS